MDLRCGRRWQLNQKLGSGGFGRVVAAMDLNGAEGAVEFVRKEPEAERELLLADLGIDRNVVPIVDLGETPDEWVGR